MIFHQIYHNLFNKFKHFLLIIFFIIFVNFILNENSYSKNIYPVVIVNNKIITNIDLNNEKVLIKINMNNIKNENILNNLAIKNLIEDTIKEIETKNIKLSKNKKEELSLNIQSAYKNLTNQINSEYNSPEIKKIISKKLETNYKWSQLISKKYLTEINLNFKEINEISKKNNLNELQRKKLITDEQVKKLNKFSTTYFNEIKKNYIIKFL